MRAAGPAPRAACPGALDCDSDGKACACTPEGPALTLTATGSGYVVSDDATAIAGVGDTLVAALRDYHRAVREYKAVGSYRE